MAGSFVPALFYRGLDSLQAFFHPIRLFLQLIIPAKFFKLFIAFIGVKTGIPLQFSQAHGAFVQRPAVRLIHTITAGHYAFVINAMKHIEHMPGFMHERFTTPAQ